jgi:hypothetical protein
MVVMKGRESTGVEMKATQIEDVVFAEKLDLVGEDMAWQFRLLDLEHRV